MWLRDIACAIGWAVGKVASIVLLWVCGFVFIKALGDARIDGGQTFALLLFGLLVSVGAYGAFRNITAVPLLFWRQRKFHVFRVIQHSTHGSAIQMRLFGVWFYVGVDRPENQIKLTLHPRDGFNAMKYFRRDNYECHRMVDWIIESIKPPTTELKESDNIIFEKYQKKSDS